MTEEEVLRIEQGTPEPLGELLLGVGFFVGALGLLVFIVCGVLG